MALAGGGKGQKSTPFGWINMGETRNGEFKDPDGNLWDWMSSHSGLGASFTQHSCSPLSHAVDEAKDGGRV